MGNGFYLRTGILKHNIKKNKWEIIEEYSYQYKDKIKECSGKGYIWYSGYFSDEGVGSGVIESYLCSADLNVETEKFIMIHEGGY